MKDYSFSNLWTRGRIHVASLGLAMMVGIQPTTQSLAQTVGGDVFTSTNSMFANGVVMFHRAADGTLTPIGTFFTGGMGTGSSLGNAGAVTLSPNRKFLYTVNAGSNTISTFALRPAGLRLIGVTSSNGVTPISLTVHSSLLYVLNAGGTGNISGFTINMDGTLTPLANSTQPLSGAGAGAAQIGFSPNGELLTVTEKGTNSIDVYAVDTNGLAGAPVVTPSAGATPYGFGFDPVGHLIVSDAFGGATGAAAVSSYYVSSYGCLPITAAAPDGQTAACWIAVSKTGSYAWTTNTGSGTVSGYGVGADGRLSLFAGSGVVADLGAGSEPSDMALDAREKYLYILAGGPGVVASFQINPDGSLNPLGFAGDLGPGMTGLAAR